MAHRHLEVVLLLVGVHDGVEPGLFAVHISEVPVGCIKCGFRAILGSNDDEVHHISRIAKVIVNAAGKAVNVLAKIGVENDSGELQAGRGRCCRAGRSVGGDRVGVVRW